MSGYGYGSPAVDGERYLMTDIEMEKLLSELANAKAMLATVTGERDTLKAASEATASEMKAREDKISRLQSMLFDNLMSAGSNAPVSPGPKSEEHDALKAIKEYAIPYPPADQRAGAPGRA